MKVLAAVLGGLMACAIAIVVVPVVLLSPACGPAAGSTPGAPAQQAAPRSTPEASGAQNPLSPSSEQRQNAAAIISEVKRESLPQQAAVIAIATGLQESGLRNLPNGDRDSRGLFQQRPSQGWGSAQQVQNPAYAAQQFLTHLQQIPNWQALPLGQVAQAVQRSSDAAGATYSRWQQTAQQLVDELWNATSGQPSPSTAGTGSGRPLGGCSTPQFASSSQVADGALQGLPWQVVSPIPNPGWRQQFPVPKWPAGLPGTRVNPPAVTPQCVAGALWTWATAHLQDPGFAHPPALTSAYASQMAGEARQKGFQVTSSPQPGDMVVWRAGSYYGSAGHVGTVIATAGDRYEVIEQNLLNDTPDMSAHWGMFDIRSVAWPDPQVAGFIHAPPGATTQQWRL